MTKNIAQRVPFSGYAIPESPSAEVQHLRRSGEYLVTLRCGPQVLLDLVRALEGEAAGIRELWSDDCRPGSTGASFIADADRLDRVADFIRDGFAKYGLQEISR